MVFLARYRYVHIMKYLLARGSSCAGRLFNTTPSARTSYVSGSTSIFGHALFQIISSLLKPLHFKTGSTHLLRPYSVPTSAAAAAALTNAMQVFPGFSAPNIPRMMTGSGVGILAFGSPICAQAICPPLTTISGLAPKNAGFQMTTSANLPTSKLPTLCDIP